MPVSRLNARLLTVINPPSPGPSFQTTFQGQRWPGTPEGFTQTAALWYWFRVFENWSQPIPPGAAIEQTRLTFTVTPDIPVPIHISAGSYPDTEERFDTNDGVSSPFDLAGIVAYEDMDGAEDDVIVIVTAAVGTPELPATHIAMPEFTIGNVVIEFVWTAASVPPIRHRQRSDPLSGGSKRHRLTTSRQSSIRQRAYL